MKNSKTCKWYDVCPLKVFYEQGRLDAKWVVEYCWRDNPECVRKKMEEDGVYHPDNMLPDGTIDKGLR
jgi:hypothetical protein